MMRNRNDSEICVICDEADISSNRLTSKLNDSEGMMSVSSPSKRSNIVHKQVESGQNSDIFGDLDSVSSMKKVFGNNLIAASLRLSLDTEESFKVMDNCAKLLVYLDDDLASNSEYHASIVNLRKFLASYTQRLNEQSFSNQWNNGCKYAAGISANLVKGFDLLKKLNSYLIRKTD